MNIQNPGLMQTTGWYRDKYHATNWLLVSTAIIAKVV